ncbi:sn-glycerol-3-phosphate ABC transporter ATP-binding protein UgpC [Psychromarinibacter sp. C21-152]|uniref:Sn-glycerol-3-phosphate ABC transporter ATP-binding protein UgpC n=1 Tax=Psychromarinibacter sediminicola TaxID=3033385 RepID=A0AAE3TAK6_9RHOB|nr:sn-glycerol-3-phosphate ABC transporter ATP-binding protein UgpC [Psychromarinibacter sediminicola]MDF0602079.1 sn-glycerol-3-phosphate ABC transporter ATP-binding protein UgpC [Psychromarinibacter sediminicola]
MARIRFQNVDKKYPNGFHAVKDLELDIAHREFVVLLGPSGCGKSTTLNMIAGLEEVSNGELLFDDEMVNYAPPHRRDVAMVFQSYALYPHKSVFDNIAFGLHMRKRPAHEIERRVRDAAKRLEIDHLLDRRPSHLSGGQRQRVALGRAMVRDPAVFLMDEPLSNLDAALRISMRAEIKELHRAMATTFVYVTHDQAEALTLADRIVVMCDGLVQQIGAPDEIYERPRNTFVASFLGSPPINYIDGTLDVDGEGTAWFRRGALSLRLPGWMADRLDGQSGRSVRLGLRAEDVDERSEPADGATLAGHVQSVLPVGSDQFLEMQVEGVDLFFRVGKDLRHKAGEALSLSVDLERLHFFDPENGRSLLWAGE